MNIKPQINASLAADHGRARPEPKPEAEKTDAPEETYSSRTTPQTGGYRTEEPLIRVDDDEQAGGGAYSRRSTPQTGGYGGRSSETAKPAVEIEDKVEISGSKKE